MADKTIKGMRRSDLIGLFDETIEKMNEIHHAHEQMREIEQFVSNNASVSEMQSMQSQSKTILDEIRGFRRELLEGEESTKSEVEKFKSEVEEKRNAWEKAEEKLGEVKGKILGYTDENDVGEEIHHPSLHDEIVRKFKEYEERHDDLYSRIETELVAGATTVGLAKAFGDKASEYKEARMWWQSSLIFTLVAPIIYFGFAFSAPELSIENLLVSFVKHIPVFTFFVWLVIFMGNRRAESKKLEESYKHKEVMAKSFTGYKKSISELNVEDSALLVKLMDNLLDAIQKDASDFLTSKGENHPLMDAAKRSKKVVSKEGKPENQ